MRLLPLILLLACSPSQPDVYSGEFGQQESEVQERLMVLSGPPGWVVSRDGSGNAVARGDSLIWTGMHLATTSCDYESPLFSAFPDGVLYRHPAYPDRVSLDGLLGFYYGLAYRLVKCGDIDKIRQAFLPHYLYTIAHNGTLNPNEPRYGKLELEFSYLRDLLAYRLGVIEKKPTNQKPFETLMHLWTYGVLIKKAACFRIHLAWLGLRTSELLGGLSSSGKSEFCSAQSGSDLPVVDHWCGQKSMLDWLNKFKINEWEYRHQRCSGWETPDGMGFERPGLDFLIGILELKGARHDSEMVD